MISGFVPFGGTNHAISFSPSPLVSVTSCACGKPADAGGVRVGSGKYINARWKTYIKPSTPPSPPTALHTTHLTPPIHPPHPRPLPIARRRAPPLLPFRSPAPP